MGPVQGGPYTRGHAVPGNIMRVSGSWPGLLTLRQGFSRATARPWNDVSDGASLRLERGSHGFLTAAADHLLELGAAWVGSPPVDTSGRTVWERAGFAPYLTLDLYGFDLTRAVAEPALPVTDGAVGDLASAVEIDRLSFDDVWQLGSIGLAEARAATPHSTFLVTRHGKAVCGFAIVGVGGTVGYLQRLGVHPDARRGGHGRALLLASLRWCQRRGARQQLLNTQPGNDAAAGLYLTEGYSVREGALSVLRYDG